MNVSKLPKLSSTSFFKLDGVHPFYEQKEGNSFYTSLCLVQFIEIFYSGRSRCAYSQVQHCGPAAYPFSHGCTLIAIILTTLCSIWKPRKMLNWHDSWHWLIWLDVKLKWLDAKVSPFRLMMYSVQLFWLEEETFKICTEYFQGAHKTI